MMNLAEKILKHSNHKKYLMGAVVVKSGRILSTGINKMAAPKRYTRPHRPMMHLHAEIDALAGLSKEATKNAILYINGKTAAGSDMTTKPCKTCSEFAAIMGIRRIVYLDKGKIKEID